MFTAIARAFRLPARTRAPLDPSIIPAFVVVDEPVRPPIVSGLGVSSLSGPAPYTDAVVAHSLVVATATATVNVNVNVTEKTRSSRRTRMTMTPRKKRTHRRFLG